MNKKMYLPAACLLFCVTHILVADTTVFLKLCMIVAAALFALLLVKGWRSGK